MAMSSLPALRVAAILAVMAATSPAAAETIRMTEALWASNCKDEGVSVLQVFRGECDGNVECRIYVDGYQWKAFNNGVDPCSTKIKAVSAAWTCDGREHRKNWGPVDHRVLTITCDR